MRPPGHSALRPSRFSWTAVAGLALVVAVGAALGMLQLALVGVAVILLAVWCHVKPAPVQRVALGLLCLSPILMVMPQLRPESYNYTAYAFGFLLVVGVVTAAQSHRRVGAIELYLVWLLASAAASTVLIHPEPSYAIMMGPVGLIGGYLALSHAAESVKRFFLGGILALAAAEAAIGVAQTFVGEPTFAIWGDQTYAEPRNYLAVVFPFLPKEVRMATGTFEHFNALGALMCLATPLAFAVWQNRRSVARGLLLLVISAGLICSFSRGALLGALVGVAVLHLRAPNTVLPRRVRVPLFAVFVIIVLALTFSAVSDYVDATANTSARVEAWSVAMTHVLSDPMKLLVGAGHGFFGQGYLAERGAVASLHSAPVQVLAETGIIGFALLSFAILGASRRAYRSRRPTDLAAATAVGSMLLHQLFDNALFGIQGVLAFGLLAIILNAPPTTRASDDRVRGA